MPVLLWDDEERALRHHSNQPPSTVTYQATIPASDIAAPDSVPVAIRDETGKESQRHTLSIVELDIDPGGAPVAAGGEHTCGLAASGTLYCWGENFAGELGTGTGNTAIPAPVMGSLDFAGVGAAGDNSCAVTSDAALYCWGANEAGQLGDGSLAEAHAPRRIAPELEIARVDMEVRWTGVLSTKGAAYNWGGFGGDTEPRRRADAVLLTAMTTGGSFACGLDPDRVAWCWGLSLTGALGLGFRGGTFHPDTVHGGHRYSSISAGIDHTCGVTTEGVAYCWGRNRFGQLGTGTTERALEPVAVATELRFESISAGGDHTCAIGVDGATYCWGRDEYGQLGVAGARDLCSDDDRDQPCATTPRRVAGGHRFAFLAPGTRHGCGLDGDGALWCWGRNNDGQLGDGSTTDSAVPVPVLTPEPWAVPRTLQRSVTREEILSAVLESWSVSRGPMDEGGWPSAG